MRDDFRGALASVAWAETQILILQQRIADWHRKDPYEVVVEPDPSDSHWGLIVAYMRRELDPIINGDVGAIINSIHTALDLLMFTVVLNNTKIAQERCHFPISRSADDSARVISRYEAKNWINPAETAAIKRAKPYRGGHHFLFPIKCLDEKRKHETLIRVYANISSSYITVMGAGIEPGLHHLDDKTVLFRIHSSKRFHPSKGNTLLTPEIIIDEPACGIDKKPAILLLRNCINTVRAMIADFP
jgi:hypothetical protein